MTAQILTIIISVLGIVAGLWKYLSGKRAAKLAAAELARKELERGLETSNTSDILDAFQRVRK
jgi:hypothetical protein